MPIPATTPPTHPAQVPFLVADSFVLALDAFMRRTGQGGHVSQSVLELDGPPDFDQLRVGARRALQKHPLLAATPRRHLWTRQPYWEVPTPAADAGLPFGCWREGEATGAPAFAEATPTADFHELLRWLSGDGFPAGEVLRRNARFDAVARRDGSFYLVLTWSHLLFDGKGAELFCSELARLCEGSAASVPPSPRPPPTRQSWWQRFRRTRPAMDYQTGLQETGAPSLGGPHPQAGGPHYQIVTFPPDQSAAIRARAALLGGGLFPVTFYVACVAHAQDRIFRHRGRRPAGYVICVPTQTRKRGAREPLFHNHVAPLFFNPRREHLATVAETAGAMKTQFATMVRDRIAESFDAVLDLMRPLPDRAFLGLIRAQYGGELCTCFSSHTGNFAPETPTFAGAVITNAYHLPCLGTPPGTGVFFGEHGGRLNVTLSWRGGALTDEERSLMVTQLRDDLLG